MVMGKLQWIIYCSQIGVICATDHPQKVYFHKTESCLIDTIHLVLLQRSSSGGD